MTGIRCLVLTKAVSINQEMTMTKVTVTILLTQEFDIDDESMDLLNRKGIVPMPINRDAPKAHNWDLADFAINDENGEKLC